MNKKGERFLDIINDLLETTEIDVYGFTDDELESINDVMFDLKSIRDNGSMRRIMIGENDD